MLAIGVDPGNSGAIAVYDTAIRSVTVLRLSQNTTVDIWRFIKPYGKRPGEEKKATLELVHAMPGNGVSSMFKFGTSFGILKMALVASEIPFDTVPSRTWQKKVGITPRKSNETKPQFKRRLQQRAQELFPKAKVTLDTADAMLMAYYTMLVRS